MSRPGVATRTVVSANARRQLNEIAVSDRATLGGLTQFPGRCAALVPCKPLEGNAMEKGQRQSATCAIISV